MLWFGLHVYWFVWGMVFLLLVIWLGVSVLGGVLVWLWLLVVGFVF